MIQFLERQDIDVNRWNDVLKSSPSETLYAYSWYLDAASDNWSAMVMDDYQFIMPVPWRKKYGIKYAYHPMSVQQLGVFGTEIVSADILKEFLSSLKRHFKFGDYRLNSQNLFEGEIGFKTSDAINHELNLNNSYDDIAKKYSTNAARNIRKSYLGNLEFRTDIELDELLKLKIEHSELDKSTQFYDWINLLYSTVIENYGAAIYGVKLDGDIQAAAMFGFSKSRAIYLMSVSNSRGKETRAMFRIVDSFIRDYSGKSVLLDFEGSNNPAIARFFSGFGARALTYKRINIKPLNLRG